MSATAGPTELHRAFCSGMHFFISKPVAVKILSEIIQTLLSAKSVVFDETDNDAYAANTLKLLKAFVPESFFTPPSADVTGDLLTFSVQSDG